MRVTLDVSPFVHRHAGLGRYAGELLTAMYSLAPQHEYTALYHAAHALPVELGIPNLKTFRVPMNAKPWRMSVLMSYYAHRTMDNSLPPGDVFHGTDHLLPPLKHSHTVFTIHDLIFRFFPQFHLPLNRWFLNLMLPKFMERADTVIAVSENTRRDVARLMNIPAEKIVVIYEGVSKRFQPVQSQDTLARVRAAYSLPEKYILFFSTIEPRKNLVTLLDAYASLLQQDANLPSLVVMGRKGWLYQDTLKHIDQLGIRQRVLLTDWVEEADVPAVLSMATVFVFPSLYEGFGLTPLEAMACGAPVISSNASSLPEVVGNAGILVDPQDVAGFARAISRVLDDESLQAELRSKGIAQAAKFTWERAARETLAVYDRVTARPLRS